MSTDTTPSPLSDEQAALKPCPFCGDSDVRNRDSGDATDCFPWQVSCRECDGQAGSGATEEEAARNWNARLSDRAPEPLVVDKEGLIEVIHARPQRRAASARDRSMQIRV